MSDLHVSKGNSATAYILDDDPGDGNYTALLRDSVGSNLTADAGGLTIMVTAGAKNTVIDRCYFLNFASGFGPLSHAG